MKSHQLSNHPIYRRWVDIKKRCYYKKAENYYLYGGRGIVICEQWKNDFMSFYNWSVENGFKKHLFIDRKDVNGNYEPSNCKWITQLESASNKRTTLYFNYKGEKMAFVDILRKNNLSNKYSQVLFRINKLGWNLDDALINKPYSRYKKTGKLRKGEKPVIYQGKEYSLIALCRKLEVENNYDRIKARINKLGWSAEKAVQN